MAETGQQGILWYNPLATQACGSRALFRHWRSTLIAGVIAAQVLYPALGATAGKTSGSQSASARKPSRQSLLAQHNATTTKKKQVQQKLRVTKRKQHQASQSLAQNRARLARVKKELGHADTSLVQARAALEKATQDLRAAEKRLAEHTAAVKARLRTIYAHSHGSALQAVGERLSFAGLASRGYMLQRVARYDLDLLDQIQRGRDRVAEYRCVVAEREVDVARYRTRVAVKRTEVANLTAADEVRVRQLQRERMKYECDLAALEQASREIEAMLRRMQQSPRGRARYLQPWRGKFIRPCAGPITSGYGSRVHPIYKIRHFHTGVDISAPHGSPIYAAGDGQVVHAARWGGYGNCVIIDHGGGVSTVYGHCSSIRVRSGQRVKRGQAIAGVGSTGVATGPHLHFEVRRNGRPGSPM